MRNGTMIRTFTAFCFLFYSVIGFSLSVTERITLPTDSEGTQKSQQMPRGLVLDDKLIVFYKGNNSKVYYNYATYDALQESLSWHSTNIRLLGYEKDKPTDIHTTLWPEPALINNKIYLFRQNDQNLVRHVYVNNFSELNQNYWTKNDATIYEHLKENLTLMTVPSDDLSYGNEMLVAGLQKREEVFASVSQRIEKQHLYFDADKKSHFEKGNALELLKTRTYSEFTIEEPPALLFEETSSDRRIHYFIPREDGKIWHYQLTGENYREKSKITLLHANTVVTPAALLRDEVLYLFFTQPNGRIVYMVRTKTVNDLGDVSYSWSTIQPLQDASGNSVIAKTSYGISAVELDDNIYLIYTDSQTRDVTILTIV